MIRFRRRLSGRAVFFIILGSFIFLSPLSWWLQKSAVLVVQSPVSGAEVWINGKNEGRTRGIGKEFSKRVSAKNHNIIVSKNGFYPWTKNISVPTGGRLELKAFLFPVDLPLLEISPTLTQTEDVNEKFVELSKTIDATGVSPDLLHVLGTLSLSSVASAEYLPGSSDMMIISSQGVIFVIETNNVEVRNFHPLYQGANPRFLLDDTKLYISDEGRIFEADLASYL